MKNLILILTLFIVAPKLSFSQYNCTYVHDEAAQQIFEKTRALANSSPANRTINYVPIQFHIIGDDAGNGYIGQKTLIDAICSLNQNFENTNIQFYINNLSFNYIDNSYYYHDLNSINTSLYSVENVINIYIGKEYQDIVSTMFAYYPVGDYITITRSTLVDDPLNNYLTHVLGHYFNLPHTFTSCYDNTIEDCPTNPLCEGQEIELVDGSNCSTAGDQFCDTPADPGIFSIDCQPYNGAACDPNGDPYAPDLNNYMALLQPCSDYHFSDEQMDHMYYNLMARINSNLIMVNGNTSTNAVEDSINIISTNSSNGHATLIWTYATYATKYLVEIARTPNMIGDYQSIIVDINNATFTGLTPNKKYYYRITPYNELGACQSLSGVENSFISNFDENPPLFAWDVSTDPYNINTNRLTIDDPQINDINISLISFDGQINYTKKRTLIEGKNIIDLKTNDLAPGIYFILVKSKQNKGVKKIIIY